MGSLSPGVDGSRNSALLRLGTLLLALGGPVTAAAQGNPTSSRSTLWGFVALGIGTTDRDSTFYAAGVGAALQRNRLICQARIASVGPKRENRIEDLGSFNRLSSFGGLTVAAQVERLR